MSSAFQDKSQFDPEDDLLSLKGDEDATEVVPSSTAGADDGDPRLDLSE